MHVEDGFGSMTRTKSCLSRFPSGLTDNTSLNVPRESGNILRDDQIQ